MEKGEYSETEPEEEEAWMEFKRKKKRRKWRKEEEKSSAWKEDFDNVCEIFIKIEIKSLLFRRKKNGKSLKIFLQILSNFSCLQEEARRSVSGMQVHRREGEGKGENGNSDGEEKKIVGDGREGKIVNTSRCKEKGKRRVPKSVPFLPLLPTKKVTPARKGGKAELERNATFTAAARQKKYIFISSVLHCGKTMSVFHLSFLGLPNF